MTLVGRVYENNVWGFNQAKFVCFNMSICFRMSWKSKKKKFNMLCKWKLVLDPKMNKMWNSSSVGNISSGVAWRPIFWKKMRKKNESVPSYITIKSVLRTAFTHLCKVSITKIRRNSENIWGCRRKSKTCGKKKFF